jgi:[ribosomal protein S5]-alanine N-acetyltransferase
MMLLPVTAELAADPEVRDSEFLASLCEATIALYPDGVPIVPWTGYLAEEQGELVGTCAFKSPPESASVEIAYFTFPDFVGGGVATRMVEALVKIAFDHGARRVMAQTLPEKNASNHILEKLGFSFAGPVEHPEDGTVWEWHLTGLAD